MVWWKHFQYRSSKAKFQGTKNHLKKDLPTSWEEDYNLQSFNRLELLDEYLEMGENYYLEDMCVYDDHPFAGRDIQYRAPDMQHHATKFKVMCNM